MKSYKLSTLALFIILAGCLDNSSSSYDDTDDLAFLEEYAQTAGVDSTSSGLLYRIIEEGEGAMPGPQSIVVAHLKGATIDENSSINTYEDDYPAILLLEHERPGYQEGFQLMNIGSIYEMAFPTQLAFGDGRVIFFERVELLNTQEGFIADYTQQEDVTTTESGLRYRVIEEGEGEKPGENSTVAINHTGTFINGAEFSSGESQQPVNTYTDGFSEGLQLMTPGSTYEFLIPANLAYDDEPPPQSNIYPGAALLFEVELLEIQ